MQLNDEQQKALEDLANGQTAPAKSGKGSKITKKQVTSAISVKSAAAAGAVQDAKNDALAYAQTYAETAKTLREQARQAGGNFWGNPVDDAVEDFNAVAALDGMDSDFFGDMFR